MLFRDDVNRRINKSLTMFLELAEKLGKIEFEITSALRPEDSDSAHSEGWAVDIACSDSKHRAAIHAALTLAGFRRIGLYDRHVHADRSLTRPQNVLWIGRSK